MKPMSHPWQLAGDYFGYPQCCIDSFIRTTMGNYKEDQLNAHFNTGFVPCPEHATQVVSGDIKLSELILPTRLCPTAFPDDGTINMSKLDLTKI